MLKILTAGATGYCNCCRYVGFKVDSAGIGYRNRKIVHGRNEKNSDTKTHDIFTEVEL